MKIVYIILLNKLISMSKIIDSFTVFNKFWHIRMMLTFLDDDDTFK